ncbi:bifunctional hydroxymethylpyrimidine kinase/phosphomethylpyrimidine kinase [Sphingomonas sp. ID0503]|uniref:bifunctional hydroxymethylpyrimidine kinase/phosphomethylpyrimidine kinase n=1 Tax=Sphingomonas sp. ID0503 TaxID=3399691 RepID=UPI003AFB4F5B
MIPRVLIVAGSDSGGGAGIQADIKTVTMLGGHAMTAITAVTAQNSKGVSEVHTIPTTTVMAQVEAVASDLGVDAVKVGMIGSAETAHALADWLGRVDFSVVFDPVMIASSGAVLADADTISAFERLMAVATVTTPNAAELSALSGLPVGDVAQAETAAKLLSERHNTAILAKGGHLDATFNGVPVVRDTLVTPGGTESWSAGRIDTRHSHGTGCTLASGIATGLAAGLHLIPAITRARAYLRAALKAAPGLGEGHGPMGHVLGGVPFEVMRDSPSPGSILHPRSG